MIENTAFDETVIALSLKKLVLLTLGATAFVIIGLWILLTDEPAACTGYRFYCLIDKSPSLRHLMGIIGVLFFGSAGLIGVQKLFDTRPGLILDSEGITDHSSGSAVGFIPWPDILGFEVFRLGSTQLLLVKVRNSNKYINTGNIFKRIWLKFSQQFGTPISISSATLQIKFDELVDVCNRYLSKYGQE